MWSVFHPDRPFRRCPAAVIGNDPATQHWDPGSWEAAGKVEATRLRAHESEDLPTAARKHVARCRLRILRGEMAGEACDMRDRLISRLSPSMRRRFPIL